MGNVLSPIKGLFQDYLGERLEEYVCVIGASNVDIVGSSPIIKNKESNLGKVSITPGGVGRNIAENLGRLEIPTVFISTIGNDYFGNIIMDSLRYANVNLTGLRKIANRRTGAYLAMLDDFRNMDFAINDMAISEHIDSEWINVCGDIISKAKIVVIDCNISQDSIEHIVNLTKGKIYVDPVSMTKAVNVSPFLDRIWAIKPNIHEAEVLSGMKINSVKDAAAALKILREKNIINPVITLGEEGVVAYDDEVIKHYTSGKMRPINSTGAGDAFLATWVASDFFNLDFSETIRNAMISSYKTLLSMESVSKDLSRINFEKWRQEVEIYEEVLEFK